MSLKFNYHCHTVLSDGKSILSEYIDYAKKTGMTAIGFSEHCPVPFYSSWNMKKDDVEGYINTINDEKIKNGNNLEIFCGMEIDYVPEYCNEILELSQIEKLDYSIGSVHYLGFFDDTHAWNIDDSFEKFQEGVQKIYKGDGEKVYKTFYLRTIEMIEKMKPTIVGHIDKIRMFNNGNYFFDQESKEYKSIIQEVIKYLKKNDTIVELNTRGTYKHPLKYWYPDIWIIKELNKNGIRMMINSDCHKTDEIIKNFEDALALLRSVDVKYLVP